MKKLFALTFVLACLLTAVVAFAQGEQVWDKNGKAPIGAGMATATITNYNHSKANVTVPLAASVSRFCVFSTKALLYYINAATGAYRSIPASTEFCRNVPKGQTAAIFGGASSAVTRVEVEKQAAVVP